MEAKSTASELGQPDLYSVWRRYWFELSLGFVIFCFLIYSIVSSSYTVGKGALLDASAISYLLCFTLTSFFLNRQQVKFPVRAFYSVASTLAGIVLYEIVYHYAFGITRAELIKDFTFLGNESGNGYFSLDWYLLIFLTIFIGVKYMAFNKPLLVLVLFDAIVMLAWIGIGYPQAFNPPWTASYSPVYRMFDVVYRSQSMILSYARIFNSLSKSIAVIPAFFFNKKLARSGSWVLTSTSSASVNAR
jgi:hypothetical protein